MKQLNNQRITSTEVHSTAKSIQVFMNLSDIPFLLQMVRDNVGQQLERQLFWEQGFGVFMAISNQSSRSTCARSDTNVGHEALAQRLCSNSPQRCEIRTRPVRFLHTKHHHPCLYGVWCFGSCFFFFFFPVEGLFLSSIFILR